MKSYEYQSQKSSYQTPVIMLDEQEITPTNQHHNKKETLAEIISKKYDNLEYFIKNSRITAMILPVLLVGLGVTFISQDYLPELQQIIQQRTGYYSLGNSSPVEDEYLKIENYVAQSKNLPELTNSALNENILGDDKVSLEYTKPFFISIPSLGIDKLEVTPNVDSTKESVYLGVLEKTLAHFKSTGLPVSDIKNNIVIYGHSASMNYNPQPSDPVLAFSFLPNLKVGDKIIIEIDGEVHNFKMYKSKVVDPYDTSIINGTKNKRTLTLFTCFPLGSDAQRYVAIARED
jgi:LPXTG-site transpeptidase (sortase) family protein